MYMSGQKWTVSNCNIEKDQDKWKLAGYHESQELLTEIKRLQQL